MTPKEKAKELICKYNLFDLDKDKSKQCALIAVDEILNQFIGIFNALKRQSVICGNVEDSENFKYWQQVKVEIENL